jgi:CRP-like cAMP-binding protein
MTTSHRSTPLEPVEIGPHLCSVDQQREILGSVPFFSGLSPAERIAVHRYFDARDHVAGAPIYFSGEPAQRLYVVAAGKVKLLRHTEEGKDILLDILGPGEYFGALATLGDAAYQETAQSQTECCTLSIDAEAFEQIMAAYPLVALRVLSIVSERLQRAQETISHLSAHGVESRIAAALLYLAGKFGEEREGEVLITVHLSREELAQMTGTTPESASRVMSQFRKDGLIRSGRQWVSVVSLDALAELAPAPV